MHQQSTIAAQAHLPGADALLLPTEAAAILKVRVQTLRLWRMQTGRGPAFIKLSASRAGRVMYRRCDIDRFLAQRVRAGTTEEPATALGGER